MKIDQFKALCKLLGNNVVDGEEWKSLKYIHTPGEASPAADVQLLLKQDKITFAEEPAGFVITEPPASDIMMYINDDTAVHTFIDLDNLIDFSFEVADDVRDIYDIVTKINSCKLPLKIKFSVQSNQLYYDYGGEKIPVYRFNTAKDVRVPFKVCKENVVPNVDYELSIKTLNGEKVSEMSDDNQYIVTISGKGKYIGTASAVVWVGKINP